MYIVNPKWNENFIQINTSKVLVNTLKINWKEFPQINIAWKWWFEQEHIIHGVHIILLFILSSGPMPSHRFDGLVFGENEFNFGSYVLQSFYKVSKRPLAFLRLLCPLK